MIENLHAAYVNLDKRRDRFLHMQKELTKSGLAAYMPVHRQPGMLPHEYKGPEEKVDMMRKRTPGAIGCYLSQMKVMETALLMGKHAMVLEDDLVFCDDFIQRLQYIDTFTNSHQWDVIWLCATVHINPPHWHKKTLGKDAALTDDPRMLRTFGCFSTHAYIVNWHSLQGTLTQLNNMMDKSIGIDYSFIQIQPIMHTYCFVPGCIKQMDNKSDIGNGFTYFSGFSKLNGTKEKSAYWWQKKMDDFNPSTFNWAEAKI